MTEASFELARGGEHIGRVFDEQIEEAFLSRDQAQMDVLLIVAA
jgi:hypothetical protein